MDGRTRYNKVVKLLEPIVGQTLSIDKLKRRVMIEVGTSDICVDEVMRLMINLGLIREVSHLMFKVVSSEADI